MRKFIARLSWRYASMQEHITRNTPYWLIVPWENGTYITGGIFKYISLNKIVVFWFILHWSLYLTMNHSLGNGLSPNKQQADTWAPFY